MSVKLCCCFVQVLFKGGGRSGHTYEPSPIATHFLSATPPSHPSGQQAGGTDSGSLGAHHPTGHWHVVAQLSRHNKNQSTFDTVGAQKFIW